MVYPKALRTHIFRLLDLKTILYKVFGPFWALGLGFTLERPGLLSAGRCGSSWLKRRRWSSLLNDAVFVFLLSMSGAAAGLTANAKSKALSSYIR